MHRALLYLALLAASSLLATTVSAEDPPPPEKKPTKPSVTDKLLQNLAPELKPDKKPEPSSPSAVPQKELDELDRTLEGMREVTKKLGEKDVSEATRRRQKGILEDIDKLIEKLKQPPPPSSQSSSNNNDSPQDQQQDKSNSPSQSKQSQNSKQQSSSQPSSGGANQQQSENSAKSAESVEKERQRQLDQRAAELAKRRALLDEVWGHLPPAIREKLLNVNSDKLLPRYEDLIRKYYEALAEPTDAKAK